MGQGHHAGHSDEDCLGPHALDLLRLKEPTINHPVHYRATLLQEGENRAESAGTAYFGCHPPVFTNLRADAAPAGDGSRFILYPHPDTVEGQGRLHKELHSGYRVRGEVVAMDPQPTVRYVIAFRKELAPGSYDISVDCEQPVYLGRLTIHQCRLPMFKM